jgi:hypothetical protein
MNAGQYTASQAVDQMAEAVERRRDELRTEYQWDFSNLHRAAMYGGYVPRTVPLKEMKPAKRELYDILGGQEATLIEAAEQIRAGEAEEAPAAGAAAPTANQSSALQRSLDENSKQLADLTRALIAAQVSDMAVDVFLEDHGGKAVMRNTTKPNPIDKLQETQ